MTPVYLLIAAVSIPTIAALIRDTRFGWVLIAALIIPADWLATSPTLTTIAGLSVQAPDIVTLLLLTHLVIWNRKGAVRIHFRLLLLGTIFALNFAAGVKQFGLATTANEARSLIVLATVAGWIYAQRNRPDFTNELYQFLRWTGWALVGLAAYNAATRGIASATTYFQTASGGDVTTGRVIVAGQAFFVLLAAVAALRERRWLTLTIFLVVILIAQHRSVWVAAIAVGLVLAACSGQASRRLVIPTLYLLMLSMALLFFFEIGGSVADNLAESSTSTGTLQGRLYDWQFLIEQQSDLGLRSILFGQPFGTGYGRPSVQGWLEYTPHNWLVVLYLRVGLIGLSAWLLLTIPPIWRAARAHHELALSAGVAVTIYGLFYHLGAYAAPALALLALGGECEEPPKMRRSRCTYSPSVGRHKRKASLQQPD